VYGLSRTHVHLPAVIEP